MNRRDFINYAAADMLQRYDWRQPLSRLGEIDLQLTDTHVHLVDLEKFTYPWLQEAPSIRRSFSPVDFSKAAQQANIGKYIFMESGALPEQSLSEVAWVNKLAKGDPRLQGIIARAEILKSGKLFPSIDALTKTPLIKGIRGRVNNDQLNSEGFVKGMISLGKNNLTVDLLLHPPMFRSADEVLKRCDSTTLILDHIGHPKIHDGDLSTWKQGISRLAQLPNMYCKISGAISYAGPNLTVATLRPCVEYVIEQFGFDRVLFGGDWPNSLRFSNHYMDWINAFLSITDAFTADERSKLFNRNADIVYGL